MLSLVKTIGNILWFCIAGLWLSISYAFAAVIMTLLVVTAPFGIASWRLATYVIWPFGRSVISRPGAGAASTIGGIHSRWDVADPPKREIVARAHFSPKWTAAA